MIKDILVNLHVDERDPAGDYAVAMAARLDAHVSAVAFAYDPVLPGSVMGGIPAEFIEAQRREGEKLAQAAIARFEEAARIANVKSESRILNASVAGAVDQLSSLARRFDISICAQPNPDHPGADELIAEGLLFESGRPVIIVPYIHKQREGATFDRAMVCWDGSRAATRAIGDAIPLLKLAKQTEVVMIASGRGKDKEVPGVDLGQHLARHGMTVDVKRLAATDVNTADTLLSYAADSGADLMVMGGYGHSRLREFILGGVTRGILATMTVPTLMSH